ncbi:MAG: hypothetical protein AB7G20_05075 [Sulfurimonas sp.]|uniref:hypothetical protein n=2 Tax=Sulfurimonas sp. TaxID=2022749 RepID=UPI003D0F0C7B
MKKIITSVAFATYIFASQNGYSTHSSWLMNINSTKGRFMAVEEQLRGFDTAMVEVGYRYEALKKALSFRNYELADYHLEKIKTAIELGYIRRPARKDASQKYFLNSVYKEFQEALKTKNDTMIINSFDNLKNSCNACHVNQKVGFIVIE